MKARISKVRVCRSCRCTDVRACVTKDGPCYWAQVFKDGTGLCSACAAPMSRGAEISACEQYRYTLQRHWGAKPNSCLTGSMGLVIMHNPSTADHLQDDPTIRRLIGWHRAWGLDGFNVVNLLPYRTPDPRVAFGWYLEASISDGEDRVALERNADVLSTLAQGATQILCAWGNLPDDLADYASVVLRDLADAEDWRVVCLGKTQRGFPIHPMARGKHRVPDDVQLIEFSIAPRAPW